MANETTTVTTPAMENASLYLDYESYNFEVTTWEQLDPKTFNADTSSGNTLTWFDTYINHKIKFFAYLNFFASDPDISGVRSGFEGKYSSFLNSIDEDTIIKGFSTETAYKAKEAEFVKTLSGRTKEMYEFFKKHYDSFFNKIGNGFFINANNERLIEDAIVKEGNRTAKKVIPWNTRTGNYINRALRAFPLMYYSESKNRLMVQFVYFIDGNVRNSVDYFSGNKILRFYLPVMEPGDPDIEAVLKDMNVKTFTANAEALNTFLKSDIKCQPSLQFNPDVKPFDTKLTLEMVNTNKDVRGCSIY